MAKSPARSDDRVSLSTRGSTDPSPQLTLLARVIEHVPITTPKPYGRDLREHSDQQVTKLAHVIRTVGFLVPILLDRNDRIIAGHARWLASKELGLATVPIIRADHLTDGQVKAFRIADNRMGELSRWNDRALALELKDLGAIEIDPEMLDLTGFEIGEIDVRIASLDDDQPDEADAVPIPAPGPAVTRLGDLFLLGPHRLLCSSSLEEESYRQLLRDGVVQMVFSDPPYNVPIQGHVCGKGKIQHREFAMASGEMSEAEFTAFLTRYLTLCKNHSADGSLHYVCMDAAHGFEVLSAARQAELSFKTTCTWAKTNAGMGSLYRQQTEFIHVFKNDHHGAAHTNNVMLGKFGRHRTTLWTYAGVNTFRKGRLDDLGEHPTVKPWALVADAIKDCTRRGDHVLDAFCGSGTTIIAAEKCGRVGCGIEIDPTNVDGAVRRWQKLTGERAMHAETGLSFADLAAQRAAQTVHEPHAGADRAQEEIGHG
jgi:DNA modification methylase